MSIWEKSDLVVAGHTIVADTPAWRDRDHGAHGRRAARCLTAGGARVVLVTEAAPAPNPAQGTQQSTRRPTTPATSASTHCCNVSARHPDQVTLVDLAAKLCPGGPPCPAVVSGSQPRPDGRHFTPAAATSVARWLFSQIFATRG